MSTPILATKLYLPPPRPNLVTRPRLIERLNEGLRQNQGFGHKLTLTSAPAGFGKTTLVSAWIASGARSVAWLSLDEGDSDPIRFLTYLVAALQTIAPHSGESVLGLLQSPQPPPIESILTALLNEITTIPDNPSTGSGQGFILVLDDYHVLDAKPIDDALTFLLDHLPPQMHLVITTPEDPPLPLPRYRVRGQLTEIRAADLRFSPTEAAEFLNQVMGLTLTPAEITALESRTEGWIAGLQLAALSMQGRKDVPGFIRTFAGDNRYIVDYLLEEVLQGQPDQIRDFLCQTAILDRLSAPLCDAVTGQTESGKILAALDRGNLFIISLDDKRRWYRYHHLFADVLQARAMEEQPDQVPLWHGRASVWYEANGLRAAAIHHALAGADFARAANLVELAWPESHRSTLQSAAMLGWIRALPDEQIRARPVLSVGCAWEHLNNGELEAAAVRLQDAERWLTRTGVEKSAPQMVIMDAEEFRLLPAEIASARTYLALAHGDLAGTVTYARRALDLLPADAYIRRGPAAALLGLAYWANGELAAAYQALADGMAGFQKAGNLIFAISGTYGLADIRMAQGRLRDAIQLYERTLQLATAQGEPVIQGTADLYLGLGELYHEQDDREVAAQHLQKSATLGEQAALPNWPHRWRIVQARIKASQGQFDDALDLLDKAARFYFRGPVPDVRPIAALRARVWIAQGRLSEALAWAHEQGLAVDDELSYLREFEYVTLVRLLIAQYQRDRIAGSIHAAIGLLERLLRTAEARERTGSAIEILVLQALAHAAQGDMPSAHIALERAVTVAAPEGYVRIFVDEGAPMAQLLREMAAHGVMLDYADKLLAAFEVEKQPHLEKPTRVQVSLPPNTSSAQSLIEPLSRRELEVLQLIAQGLSNNEISEKLFLALSTVKGHNRIIFGKLQVQRRTEAVARARELGLV